MRRNILVYPKEKVIELHTNRKIYETSDGQLFDSYEEADFHEFYYVKLNYRKFPFEFDESHGVFDIETLEDVKQLLDDNFYKDSTFTFNIEELELPNSYVFVEESNNDGVHGDNDTWARDTVTVSVFTLEDYRHRIKRFLDIEYKCNIKKISDFD